AATLQEIPQGVPLYRAALPRPKERIVAAIKAGLKRRDATPPPATAAPSHPSTAAPSPSGGISWPGRIMGLMDRLTRRYLLIPDDLVLWTGPAVRRGLQAVKDFQPTVILATAPYFTDLIIGARLAQRAGLPWIADYRDLWTGDVLREWVPGWRRRLELGMERRVLATASAVLTVSEPKTQVMRQRLPHLPAEAFITLTNGYDLEEFADITPETGDPGQVRIVYAGRLFKNRRGYELLEAAGALLRERPEYRQRLRIEYYGGVAPEIAAQMEVLTSEQELTDIVRFFPDVPYQRSKALQKGADVLLLIVDRGETTSGVIPGKLFEYLAAGRPILCIAAEGATPDIIRQGRLGWVVPPGDVTAIKTVLDLILSASAVPYACLLYTS
ncbi:MAG TPA: hypothetical protein DEP36_00675, partial [Gammaproteobacteria bacterium]|nr:hypothetical protein [Gammaproteobacteria bacterium]